MGFKNSLLVSFFLLFHCANAFNITKLLSQYPDFSTLNSYLTQTQLATEINSRQTITLLAVDNGAISELSGKPTNVIRKILSVHVVLDYYDLPKLQKLSNKTAILITLFQSTGQATGQQGFLNVTNLSAGGAAFGPAEKGATIGANLVKSVASQPYNISVLQISAVIVPTGIENSATPPSSSPAKSPSPAPPKPADAPAPSTIVASPPKTAAEADAPAADAPAGKSASAGVALGLSSLGAVMINYIINYFAIMSII